jgi:hypothetical protein
VSVKREKLKIKNKQVMMREKDTKKIGEGIGEKNKRGSKSMWEWYIPAGSYNVPYKLTLRNLFRILEWQVFAYLIVT